MNDFGDMDAADQKFPRRTFKDRTQGMRGAGAARDEGLPRARERSDHFETRLYAQRSAGKHEHLHRAADADRRKPGERKSAAPVFPEYAMDWVVQELDEFEKREGDRFTISEENKQTLREIYPYWKGRTLQDKGYAAYPESARTIYDIGIIRNEGNITSGDAHLAVELCKRLKVRVGRDPVARSGKTRSARLYGL